MSTALVERLSRQSVERHFDAYADVDWDGEDGRIDPADPRWEAWPFDPLSATEWYRSQPPEVRARIGLHRVAAAMRTGWEFENVLQRGLLAYAFRLPNGSAEFRYLHHEVIEESQHTLMFQEFVNRTGLPVRGIPAPGKWAAQWLVVPLNRWFPELFFLFVLGGEEPVDYLQRRVLREMDVPPILERIMRIHVTEEARHVSFARSYLRDRVPQLGWARRQVLGTAAPVLLGSLAWLMVQPPRHVIRANGGSWAVIGEVYRSRPGRRVLRDAVAKPRRLCAELGLMNPVAVALWKGLGLWDRTET